MNEAHIPKRPPIEKRALGALEYRKGHRDADAMQSQYGGKRYNLAVTKKLAEEDTKKVLKKVSQRKLGIAGTMTSQPADLITVNPEKNITSQSLQN